MLDWTTIQNAIKNWAGTWSGLPVIWDEEPSGWIPKAYIQLRIGSVRDLGIDAVDYSYVSSNPAGMQMVPEIMGQREFTVDVLCINRSQQSTAVARHHLERLRTSLSIPSVRDGFTAAGIAFIDAFQDTTQGHIFQDRMESRGVMELHFAAAIHVAATDSGIGYFDKIRLTLNLDGVDVIDDEQIP